MKQRERVAYLIAAMALALGCGSKVEKPAPSALPAIAFDDAPVTSGHFIQRFEEGREERVWFDGVRHRAEHFRAGELYLIAARGEQTWFAYPRAGRKFLLEHAHGPSSLLEKIRLGFKDSYSEHEPTKRVEVFGVECVRYEFMIPADRSEDSFTPARWIDAWIVANSNFPLPISIAGEYETTYLELGASLDAQIFIYPENFEPIITPQTPPGEIKLVLRVERGPAGEPEKVETLTFETNGDQFTRTSDQPAAEPMRPQGRAAFVFTAFPEFVNWENAVLIGSDETLGHETQIYESFREDLPQAKAWVADVPGFGTVSLRHETIINGERIVESVISLTHHKTAANHVEDSSPGKHQH